MDVTLKIDGMSCAGCVAAVQRVLSNSSGVTGAAVDLATGRARVSGERLDPAALAAAVEEAGYEATVEAESR